MTLNLGQVFKAAVVVGAGYEIGRILPGVIIRVLSKKSREEIKLRYRQGMKKAEKDGKNIRLVDQEFRR